MNSKKNSRYLNWILVFVLMILLVLSLLSPNKFLLFFATAIFVCFIYYTLKNLDENVFMFCFLICLFTFILCGQIFCRLFDVYYYDFPNDIELHTDICITISIIGLLIGYVTLKNIKFTFEKKSNTTLDLTNSIHYINIRKMSKLFFFMCYLFWILTVVDVILFVRINGYIAYYVSYSSRIPSVLRQIGYFSPTFFYIFLATLPSKKESKIPFIMYLFYALLSLGTGRRVNFIVCLLIVFSYAICRNKINPGEKPWISKKALLMVCACIPVLLITMYLFEYSRSTYHVGNASDYNALFGFFVRQGTSVNVIKYAELYQDRLDPSAHYSLYNTIRWIQNSPLNAILQLDYSFGNQSVQTAMHGTYLADFVSYHANTSSYLTGVGYGSCYFEELYIDYGYIGVLIGNIIYGNIFRILNRSISSGSGVWKTTICLFMLNSLFQAPRSTFDAFFGRLLYPDFWFPIVAIYIVVNLMRRKSQKISITRQ